MPMADRKVSQLSGGQQQRVALARALAPHPRFCCWTNRLSALDLKLRQAMQIELKRLQLETGITFVFVTHDQEEALTMSDRIAVMSNGQDPAGRHGRARSISTRRTGSSPNFIGETNFLSGEAQDGGLRIGTGETIAVAGLKAGGKATVIVRPEQLRLGAEKDGGLNAKVRTLVYFGTDTHCHLALSDGTEIVARLQSPATGDAGLSEGQAVGIRFAEGAVQLVED
jgi:spermidine/putrescine transport system ATP-binding protein